MSAPLLELRQLSVSFATDDGTVRAVDGIDLALQRGRTLGLVGESGCGKSITAYSVMRLLPEPQIRIARGQILFRGRDLAQASARVMREIQQSIWEHFALKRRQAL